MLSFLISSMAAFSASVTVGDLVYSTSSTTASVTSYTGNPRNIVIPSKISVDNKTYSVTTIENRAFSGCKKLESIVIPNSITVIGEDYKATSSYVTLGTQSPFYNCTSLKKIVFEDGNNTLYLGAYGAYSTEDEGRGMFYWSPLEELYIGRDLSYTANSQYGYSPFYKQQSLTKVIVGNQVRTLWNYLFHVCSSLENVILGDNITKLGKYCFANCSIKSIIVPEKLGTIGEYAFYNNRKLTSIHLPQSVISIENAAFFNCFSLEDVNFPDKLYSIGEKAFANTSIQEVNLPKSVKTLGKGVFEDSSVRKADLYCSCEISEDAFYRTPLTECYISSNVTSIETRAFKQCSSLKYIKIDSGIKSIKNQAFSGCKNLESIIIPSSVTQIGESYQATYYQTPGALLPFSECTSLKKVIFEDGSNTLLIGGGGAYSSNAEGRGLFYDCPLEEIYLGRNLAYDTSSQYGKSPFYNKDLITRITIGNTVTSLGLTLFWGCTKIQTVVLLANYPPKCNSNTFHYILDEGLSFYVPYNCSANYTSAENWPSGRIKEWFQDDLFNYFPLNTSCVEISAKGSEQTESLLVPSSITWDNQTFTVSQIADSAFDNWDTLTSVTFPESIKIIGKQSFQDCNKLNTVNFTGQTEIREEAFLNCTSLINIKFPESLIKIGRNAFRNDNSITQIDFNEGLTEIGFGAFMDCAALTAVVLPNSITRVEDSAFENCKKLTYASLGNTLESLGNSAFRNCGVLTEISIPGTAETIGAKAFQGCKTLALATLNSGTKTIGNFCFDGCSELLSMTIPGTVISIGSGSFNGCTSLSSLSFSNGEEGLEIPMFTDSPLKTLRIGRNLTYPFSDAQSPFRDRTTLSRVMFTGNYVTHIYDYLLDGCNKVSSITLPETLQIINSSAFRNCSSLPTMTLPASLNEIKSNAFDGCTSLSSLTINDSENELTLGTVNSMFHDAPLQSLYLGRNIAYTISATNYIEEHAPFYQQKNLTDLKFSDSGTVTNIPYYFMYEAENLPLLSFPASIQEIGKYAFYGNSTIPSVVIPDEVTNIGSSVFRNCSSLESIHLSEKLTGISSYLLAGCSSLKSITIPASVNGIETGAFNECSALESAVIGNSPNPLQIGKDSSNVGMFCTTPLTTLYIGRNLTYSSVAADGYSPFHNMESLNDISFSQGGEVTEIGNYLFDGCASVKNFRLPESLVTIKDNAFSNMSSLEYCNLPNSVTSLGKAVFMNDTKLETVLLSNKIPVLDENLFNGCSVLNNLSIPASVKNLNKGAFTDCSSMSNLRFENGSEIMTVASKDEQNSLFADCPLSELYLGRWLSYDVNTKSIAPFYYQGNLSKLTLGETVGTIGKYLFTRCSSLPSVEIPDGVESIGEEAFFECYELSNLKLGEGLTSLGERAFSYNLKLDNVKMPSTLTSISDGCFSYCTSLVNLELNSNLGIIGPRAFEQCSKLVAVDIPAKVYGLGVEAFQSCSSLSTITIPEGAISSIGARAFKDCNNITNVVLGSNVTSLGVNCFQGCGNVLNVKSYNPVPPVGSPGFPEVVIDNGTVFVPNESVEDYRDSDTWWEFFNIRPFTDATLLTSIVLNQTEASIRDTETLSLSAVATPTDATDKTVLYRSNDTSVATVDNNGLVTGVAPGTVVITAYAADGSGAHAECNITVHPTLVERLEANSQHTIKVGRSDSLAIAVYPENATDKSLSWKSDNNSVMKVETDGTFTAIYKGTAKLTATANDGSGASFTCNVTVIPPTKGDSNDNDAVTITDAVNIANYAVGNEVKDFCFEAADVNEDNKITLADASGTISIILDTPPMEVASKVRTINNVNTTERDMLVIDDFAGSRNETVSVKVSLANVSKYVAMQADIVMPEGLSVVSVETDNMNPNHNLITKQIDSNTLRVVLFDPNNSYLNDETLFTIKVKINETQSGNITINNIVGADAEASEYLLTATGGQNLSVSGVGEIEGNIKISVRDNEIKVFNAEGLEVMVCDMEGAVLNRLIAKSVAETISVEPGVYIVKVCDVITKVIVK